MDTLKRKLQEDLFNNIIPGVKPTQIKIKRRCAIHVSCNQKESEGNADVNQESAVNIYQAVNQESAVNININQADFNQPDVNQESADDVNNKVNDTKEMDEIEKPVPKVFHAENQDLTVFQENENETKVFQAEDQSTKVFQANVHKKKNNNRFVTVKSRIIYLFLSKFYN